MYRPPFGVKTAPTLFQQIIDSIISGLPGVVAYLDDITICGATLKEHNTS